MFLYCNNCVCMSCGALSIQWYNDHDYVDVIIKGIIYYGNPYVVFCLHK